MCPDMITTCTWFNCKNTAENTEDKRMEAFTVSLKEYSHYQCLSVKNK